MKKIVLASLAIVAMACQERLPVIKPTVITEELPNDTDDPAIWINPTDPSKSIIFGTDKKTQGGVYAFDLDGKIIKDKSITNIERPNNVDLAYGFKVNDSTATDVIVFTEREKQQIRMFSVPDMTPLDNGGFKVFTDATQPEHNLPMGIALYKSPKTGTIYAIVGRKAGPTDGYLYQYELVADTLGIHANLVRKFGKFSGVKEIEAIAVDNENGIVYCSDEGVGIRKYHAEPSMGNEELAIFGGKYFKDDIEGIAIAKYPNGKGFLIVSNQQAGTFNIFDLKTNAFIKELNLGTLETDGCDVTTVNLGGQFPGGLFVSMNDNKNFYFHDLNLLGLLD